MNVLLENKQLVDESTLYNDNRLEYARVFSKVTRYASMANTVSESRYYHSYKPEIFFSPEERNAIQDMLCTLRSHIYESMNAELKQQLLTEGIFDTFKEKVSGVIDKTKEKVSDIKQQVAAKYQAALKLVNELIKKGVSTVRELITAFGKILTSLGDNLKSALEKLGAFKAVENQQDTESEVNISKELKAAEISDADRPFISHVIEYIKLVTESKGAVKEGFMDTVGNNPAFQYIMSVSKDRKRWSFWHTLLVSLVGTFIITVVLPMLLTAFGVASNVIVAATTAIALVWSTRSLIRVIFNRWLSKSPDEKFWNWQTVLGVVLSTVPIGLMQIPAVREWVIDGITKGLQAIGFDKLVNNIEELFAKLVEKFGGTNWTQSTEVTEVGKEVTQFIESYANAGDAHTDLFQGKNVAEYVAHLFGKDSHLTQFQGNSTALKDWLLQIGHDKFTNSPQMLSAMTGSLPSDAPLTGIIDGNTFGHVSRSALQKAIEDVASKMNVHAELINVTNDSLREATNSAAGTSFALVLDANATTDNATLLNTFMKDVAKEVGAKATSGYNTFISVANQLKDSFTSFHTEEIINNVTTHSFFKNMMDCFNPVFNPFFNKSKWGDYDIRPGSNTSGYRPYVVTEVKHMTLDEVAKLDSDNPALYVLVKHIQDVQKQHQTDIQAGIEQSKEDDGKISKKYMKTLKKHMQIFHKNSNIKERQLMVIFVSGQYKSGKEVKELKNEPFVAMDMATMYCADIMPWRKSQRRKNIYPILGLFSRLDFIPKEKNDNETKEFIHKMLATFTETAVKDMVENGTAAAYIKTEDKKYVPSDPDKANESYFDTGGLTVNQICDVLNGKENAYTLLDGRYAKNVRVTMDKESGDIKKKTQSDNNRVIEKKRYKKEEKDGKVKFIEDKNGEYDYVDAKIVPFINKNLIDQIKEDSTLADLVLDEDGKSVNKDLIDNKNINLKQWLFRPAKSFSKKDETGLAKNINEYLKGHDKKEIDQVYDYLKKFIELVWRGIYEHIENTYSKRNKESNDSNS